MSLIDGENPGIFLYGSILIDVIPDVTGQRKVIDLSSEDEAIVAGLIALTTHYSVSSRELLIVGRVEKAKLYITCGGQK